MASSDLKWNDGINAPWNGSAEINPISGDGDTTISVSGSENDKLDKEAVVDVQLDDYPDKVEKVKIKQKGRRVAFCTKDGVPFLTGDGSSINVLKSYALSSWDSTSDSPLSVGLEGYKDQAPKWDFYLIDTKRNVGKSKPIGKLKKNNLFRFEDGSFAPTVGITEAMRAECDVELYLDEAHEQKYCDAGAFNAEAFYNEHGMAKLYNSSGEAVRVLRPWETTSTDYTIGLACDKSLVVVDGAILEDGKQWRGVIEKGLEGSFGDFTDVSKYPVLEPTAISPGPVCTIGNKTRSFFYLYEGENNCKSSKGISNICDIFYNGRTYPRVSDMHQINNMIYARSNNADPEASYPFAEGGYFALNAYICYLEMMYGTKMLHTRDLFGSGISSNDPCNASSWRNVGGVRYKLKDADDWKYATWATNPTDLTYNTEAAKTHLSNFINLEHPKEQCMESFMVASFIVERDIAEGEEFDFYGGTYWYKNVQGATALKDGDMNAQVFKIMSGSMSAFDGEGNPAEFDLEVILRMSLFGGMNLSGDVFRYWGGGYEQVGTLVNDPNTSRVGNPVKLYLNPDQKTWAFEKATSKADNGVFDFESQYMSLGEFTNLGNSYTKRRLPLSDWKTEKTNSFLLWECYYQYDDCYWSTTLNARTRIAARFGGHAHYGSCSPRNLYANNAVSYGYRATAGSAQILIDVS